MASDLINQVYNELEQHGEIDENDEVGDIHTMLMPKQVTPEQYNQIQAQQRVHFNESQNDEYDEISEEHEPIERPMPRSAEPFTVVIEPPKQSMFTIIFNKLQDGIIFFAISFITLLPYLAYVITIIFPFTKNNHIYSIVIRALIGSLIFGSVKAII